VTEELRFFLRTAAYTGLIGTIYWFVSYEVAGTVLLAALFVAAVAFAAVAATTSPASRHPTGEGSRVARVAGFAEDPDAPAPLELEEDLFPTQSPWPAGMALALTLVTLGAVYGPWLWVPGAGLALSTGLGWATQLRA